MNLGGSIRINKFGILLVSIIILLLFYFTTSGSDESKAVLSSRTTDEINLRKLLIASIVAAQKGGVQVVDVSNSLDFGELSKGKTKEGINDPVTQADFRSHCVMEHGLKSIFPELHIVSEEDSLAGKCLDLDGFSLDPTVVSESIKLPDVNIHSSELTVWIDPLDATKEFTEHLFQYVTVMICIAHLGRPIIGIVHNPFEGRTIWAWDNYAVSDDLYKVLKKENEIEEDPVVTISRSHSGDVQSFVRNAFGEKTRILSAAGAGFKVMQVLFSNATMYIHKTAIKKWDLCAGNAILNAVGGRMTDFNGKEINYTDDKSYKHDTGILAALSNQKHYLEKLKKLESSQNE